MCCGVVVLCHHVMSSANHFSILDYNGSEWTTFVQNTLFSQVDCLLHVLVLIFPYTMFCYRRSFSIRLFYRWSFPIHLWLRFGFAAIFHLFDDGLLFTNLTVLLAW